MSHRHNGLKRFLKHDMNVILACYYRETIGLLFCNFRWHICLGDLVEQDRGACNVSINS